MVSILLFIAAVLFDCKGTLKGGKCMGLCILYNFTVIFKISTLYF